jgi:hypothetical protein
MTPAILEKRLAVPEYPGRRDSTFAARPAVAPYQISIAQCLAIGRWTLSVERWTFSPATTWAVRSS